MPLYLAPFAAIALGVAFAWRSPPESIAQAGSKRDIALWTAVLFAGLSFLPAVGFFLLAAPDWSLGYLAPSARIPSAVLLIISLIIAALIPGAFWVARPLVQKRRFSEVLGLGGAPVALGLICGIVLYERMLVVCSYHQFRGGFGLEPLTGSPLGYTIIWVDGLLIAAFVLSQGRPWSSFRRARTLRPTHLGRQRRRPADIRSPADSATDPAGSRETFPAPHEPPDTPNRAPPNRALRGTARID